MSRRIQTALAAVAVDSVRRDLPGMLAQSGVALLDMPADGRSALKALETLRPDLLLADHQLPLMEGANLMHRALCTSMLAIRPAGMLLYEACYPVFLRGALEEAGVAFVEKPLNAESLGRALADLRAAPVRFLDKDVRRADKLLDTLGVPEHRGRLCLKTASLICLYDGRCQHRLTALYPRVAEICNLNAGQVERAIRHVIGLAWQSDKFDNQYRIFADTIDAGRGQPTCGEMISRLADILRLEG